VNAESEILFAAGFWKVGKATAIIVAAFHELNRRIAARGGSKVVIKIVSIYLLFGRIIVFDV
jgi:hypothetical protein